MISFDEDCGPKTSRDDYLVTGPHDRLHLQSSEAEFGVGTDEGLEARLEARG
jgi:hypothetical protein